MTLNSKLFRFGTNIGLCHIKMRLATFAIVVLFNFILICECKNRVTIYAGLGETVRLQCSGGQFFCFSTYTLTNSVHQMIMINASNKYQVEMGSLTIRNLEKTDAGFYACSSNCAQMKSENIDYYVQPTSKQHYKMNYHQHKKFNFSFE